MLKVFCIKGEYLTAPFERRSAMRAKAAYVNTAMGEAGDFALIDRLRVVLNSLASAFEQKNFFILARKLHGKHDACGTGANNAYICLLRVGGRFVSERSRTLKPRARSGSGGDVGVGGGKGHGPEKPQRAVAEGGGEDVAVGRKAEQADFLRVVLRRADKQRQARDVAQRRLAAARSPQR